MKLYNTTNGVNWTLVSTIYDGPGADETDFEFLPDGSIITSMRIQSFEILGDNSRNTLISTAEYPYVSWNRTISTINRLDGPCLFTADNKTFAIGRFQPHRDSLFHQTGSAFSMKKTSLFYIESDRLVYLSDLPSNGDTSYPAAVVRNGFVYISYYSCVPLFDYPWFLGMEFPTSIYIAKINLTSLITLGSKKNYEYVNGIYTAPTFPSIDYGYIIGWIIICGLIGTLLIRKVVLIEKIREE